MAYKLDWTEIAKRDLRDIVLYVRKDKPDAAARLGRTIVKHFEALPEQPMLGRVVPEKGDPNIREIVLAPYRLVYTLDNVEKVVWATRIWHSSRGNLTI